MSLISKECPGTETSLKGHKHWASFRERKNQQFDVLGKSSDVCGQSQGSLPEEAGKRHRGCCGVDRHGQQLLLGTWTEQRERKQSFLPCWLSGGATLSQTFRSHQGDTLSRDSQLSGKADLLLKRPAPWSTPGMDACCKAHCVL